jgi:oligoendopeptidase F
VFGDNVKLFARIHNTLAKEKEIEDRWRKMPTPQTGRHLANHVEPEVVEALRDAVVAAYPKLSHRYYELNASGWARHAGGLGPQRAAADGRQRVIGWDERASTVLDAYAGSRRRWPGSPQPVLRQGLDRRGVKPGKAPGAFAHPTVAEAHPYVMLNYLGKPRDVMTLAHELGHGVHQVLAAGQGELLSRRRR